MKKNHFKIILVIVALTIGFSGSICVAQQKKISITELGYEPGSRKNAIPYIIEAIKQCSSGDATIIFPKGRYDFWQDLSSEKSRFSIGIPMTNLKNIVIDGDSSEFIFHGNMQIASIIGCENITLKNFSVDWDFPFIFEGRYLNSTDEYIELEFDKEQYRYVIEDGKFFLTGEG